MFFSRRSIFSRWWSNLSWPEAFQHARLEAWPLWLCFSMFRWFKAQWSESGDVNVNNLRQEKKASLQPSRVDYIAVYRLLFFKPLCKEFCTIFVLAVALATGLCTVRYRFLLSFPFFDRRWPKRSNFKAWFNVSGFFWGEPFYGLTHSSASLSPNFLFICSKSVLTPLHCRWLQLFYKLAPGWRWSRGAPELHMGALYSDPHESLNQDHTLDFTLKAPGARFRDAVRLSNIDECLQC